jgi:drug/metabolite transporter (DMT)-like permease
VRTALPWFLATLLLWSSMEVVSKPLMGGVDPFGLTLVRFSTGLAVLAASAALTGRLGELKRLGRGTVAALLLLGLLNTSFSMSMLQLAVARSSASLAATMICSNPLLVVLFSVASGMERFSPARLAAFSCGAAGVYLVMYSGEGRVDIAGSLFALASAISFAAYVVIGKRLVSRATPLSANIVSFAGGVGSLALFMVLSGRRVFAPSWDPGLADVLSLAWLGVFVSGVGYLTFFRMLRSASASSSSLVFFVKPVVATALAAAILGERPGAGFLAGLVLISAGSAAALLLARPVPGRGGGQGSRRL